MRRTGFWLIFTLVSFSAAHAWQAENTARFEVASVKPAGPPGSPAGRSGGGPGTSDPGLLRYGRITLKTLVQNAYKVEADRVHGPQWMATEAYAIEAKVPAGATKDQVPIMLQNLLRDRFHLALHTESTNFPTYELVVARGGPKIRNSTASAAGDATAGPREGERATATKNAEGFPVLPPGRTYQATYSNGVERASFRDISMADVARILQFDAAPVLGDPFSPLRIADHTGLDGKFEFTLEFRIKLDADSTSPDLFYALEKQLGLRLQKGEPIPLDVLVIDHLDRTPTEN